MKLVILAAFPQELKSTLQGLGARKVSGKLSFPLFSAQSSSCDILLTETGMGFRNAEAAMKYVLQEFKPDIILSIGFGGALYDGGEIGDLIWASKVVLIRDDAAESIALPSARETAGRLVGKIAMREGSILTLEKRMIKAGIDKSLYDELPCPVCDMETFPLAKIAVGKGIPFFAIRSITDRVDEDIPAALYDVVDDSGRFRLSRAITLLVRKPGLLSYGISLGRNSAAASRNLWHAVRSLTETF